MEFELKLTKKLKKKVIDFLEEKDDGSKLDDYLLSLTPKYEGLEKFLCEGEDCTIMPTIKEDLMVVILKKEVV